MIKTIICLPACLSVVLCNYFCLPLACHDMGRLHTLLQRTRRGKRRGHGCYRCIHKNIAYLGANLEEHLVAAMGGRRGRENVACRWGKRGRERERENERERCWGRDGWGKRKVDLFGALLPGEKGSSRSWEGGRPGPQAGQARWITSSFVSSLYEPVQMYDILNHTIFEKN